MYFALFTGEDRISLHDKMDWLINVVKPKNYGMP